MHHSRRLSRAICTLLASYLVIPSLQASGPGTARRVVLVTGGSRGIGRAISKSFAARGDQVVINYRSNRTAAEETLAELAGEGHCVHQCDVSSPEQCLQMVNGIASRYGRMDVLVNNAATYMDVPLLSTSFEDWTRAWQETLTTNVVGPASLSWAAANVMARQGGGAIVSVSSRGAKRGEPFASPYGASKAALNSMSQSLAAALGGQANIAVSAVAPGFVETDMASAVLEGPVGGAIRAQSPFGRVATPQEIARVVVFLAEPESCWLRGAVVDCNGASYLH